jgi:hypothetical protein
VGLRARIGPGACQVSRVSLHPKAKWLQAGPLPPRASHAQAAIACATHTNCCPPLLPAGTAHLAPALMTLDTEARLGGGDDGGVRLSTPGCALLATILGFPKVGRPRSWHAVCDRCLSAVAGALPAPLGVGAESRAGHQRSPLSTVKPNRSPA